MGPKKIAWVSYSFSEVFDLKPTSGVYIPEKLPEKLGSFVQFFDTTNG